MGQQRHVWVYIIILYEFVLTFSALPSIYCSSYLYVIRAAFNRFPDFFCTGIENCRRLLNTQYFIAIHLMRWLNNFYDFRFNESHSRKWNTPYESLIVAAGGFQDTLEERYAIKFCFKVGKTTSETYGILRTAYCLFAWIDHQFLSGIRDSRKAGSLF